MPSFYNKKNYYFNFLNVSKIYRKTIIGPGYQRFSLKISAFPQNLLDLVFQFD